MLPVTLKDRGASTTPMSHLTGLGRAKASRAVIWKGARRWQERGFSAGGWVTSTSLFPIPRYSSSIWKKGLADLTEPQLTVNFDEKLTRSSRSSFLLAIRSVGALRVSNRGYRLKSDQRRSVPEVGSPRNHPHPPAHHSCPHPGQSATRSVTQQTSDQSFLWRGCQVGAKRSHATTHSTSTSKNTH